MRILRRHFMGYCLNRLSSGHRARGVRICRGCFPVAASGQEQREIAAAQTILYRDNVFIIISGKKRKNSRSEYK